MSCFYVPTSRVFQSQRLSKTRRCETLGYRFFDEKPTITESNLQSMLSAVATRGKATLPCCSADNEFLRSLSLWLQSTTGGGKAQKQAEISVTRILKFFKYCCDESGEDESCMLSTVELVDYFLCSSKYLTDFLDYLEERWQMDQSGQSRLRDKHL